MRFSSYGLFVAAMGYSPADDAVIDTGGHSVWRVSRKGNPCRFSADGETHVTVCKTPHGIMYVENRNSRTKWHGPFPSFDAAIVDADSRIFGG